MKYRVLVRFLNDARKDDFEKRFDSYADAVSYFQFLVVCDFDGLLSSFWHCSLSKGKSVLRTYSKY